jgi:hypothetical protein
VEGLPCLIASSPDNVVENIRVQYGKPSVGGCYTPMLDSLFRFHPDPVDSNTTPEPFLAPWSRDVEGRVAANIAAAAVGGFSVVIGDPYQNPILDSGPPQRETRFYNYRVLLFLAGGALRRYQGQLEITFEQEDGLWKILFWIDHTDGSGYPTWTRLRADHFN